MLRRTWMAIPALTVGILVALPAGAQDTQGDQTSLEELLQSDGMTQEELAVELLRALDGAELAPPDCVPGQEMFDDVPASSPFCPFIEELARRDITTGCDDNNFCPGDPVTRAQMAVFVVRSTEACPTLDPSDEMIRVGGVCIDKYEASLWDAPVGGNQITGAIPCSTDGQDCDNIYARSVAGVQPRDTITWFQAQAALANSGKRLLTSAEWQMAVRGTPDPGGAPGPEDCNVSTGSAADTGSFANCVSALGAFDMVGNLWEWVSDWVPAATASPGWGGFSDDVMSLSGASTTAAYPGALIRGGNFGMGANAGPFAVSGVNRPYLMGTRIGFRGTR